VEFFVQRKTWLFISFFISILGLDQVTKIWVVNNIDYRTEEITVIPHFFSLVHAQNPGAAFGLFGDLPATARMLIFLGFTVVAIFIIIDLWRRLPNDDWFMSITLGLVMGGAIGNGIDRVDKQTVTDFLLVYTDKPGLRDWLINTFGTNEWPSFNVADSALVVGMCLFVIHYLFLEDKELDAATPANSDAPEPAPTEASALTSAPDESDLS